MIGKVAVLAGLLGSAAYVMSNVTDEDPSVYPYSKDQVVGMLTTARTTLPRRDGDGTIEIWSAGRSGQGVTLNMRYDKGAPVLACQAVVTAVDADKSRVAADCGAATSSTSALSRTQAQLRVPMFAEHIEATLRKRPFDRANVDRGESAAVFQNLGGMQRESLQRSAADREAQRAATGR